MMAGMTTIVRTISRLLFPFMVLFGVYIILHGHLTPGGGFQGGVIIAASFVMLWLAYSLEQSPIEFKLFRTEVLEAIGGLTLATVGLVGLVMGVGKFFGHVLPLGILGNVFSGGDLPLLNIGVGIEVAASIILVFYAMLRKVAWDEK
jgi:multicomponent Na+:H+ antiporter subunit B